MKKASSRSKLLSFQQPDPTWRFLSVSPEFFFIKFLFSLRAFCLTVLWGSMDNISLCLLSLLTFWNLLPVIPACVFSSLFFPFSPAYLSLSHPSPSFTRLTCDRSLDSLSLWHCPSGDQEHVCSRIPSLLGQAVTLPTFTSWHTCYCVTWGKTSFLPVKIRILIIILSSRLL